MLPKPYSVVGIPELETSIPLNKGDLVAFDDGEIGEYDSNGEHWIRVNSIDSIGMYSFRLVSEIDFRTTVDLMD